MIKEADLVAGDAVADLLVHLGRAALQRLEIIELVDRDWILDPCKELLIRDNPYLKPTGLFKSWYSLDIVKFAYRFAVLVPSPRTR